jgi:hypothetical protein
MPTAEEVAKGHKQSGAGSGGKRGSVNNSNRLQAFTERRGSGGAEWSGCDPQWLQAVITKITGMGGAVTFSLSRDLGAHGLTLLLDGNKQSLWFNGDADLNSELEAVDAILDTML